MSNRLASCTFGGGMTTGQWLKSPAYQEWIRMDRKLRYLPDEDYDSRVWTPERGAELRLKYETEKKQAEEEKRAIAENARRLLAVMLQEAKDNDGDHKPLCKKPRMDDPGQEEEDDDEEEDDSENDDSEDEESGDEEEIQPPLQSVSDK